MKELPMFSKKVIEYAMRIPFGRVTTYGHLARAAGGGAQSARSVTSILSKAPDQSKIPYHRIVYANGRVWFNNEHEKKRRAQYKKEGIEVDAKGRITNWADVLFSEDDLN